MCEYVESKLENNTIAVSNAQCSEILKHFHILRCKLNPEKYSNKHVLHGNLTNVNLMKFCYYISNVLVCISHDIVYAINKELKTLPNYNDKNKTGKTLEDKEIKKIQNYNDEVNKVKTQNNIYNIIVRSFNGIMEALTSLKSGMLFIETFSYDYDKNTYIYNKFQKILDR